MTDGWNWQQPRPPADPGRPPVDPPALGPPARGHDAAADVHQTGSPSGFPSFAPAGQGGLPPGGTGFAPAGTGGLPPGGTG